MIIWLGEASPWSDFTIQLLNEYYDASKIFEDEKLRTTAQVLLIFKLRGTSNPF